MLAALTVCSLFADVKLADIFCDHMVLQRDVKVPIHGTAAPNEKITVTFNGQTVSTTADAKGRWTAFLAPMSANKKGQILKAAGAKNSAAIANVLIGDVWLCGGQSNMAMNMWTNNPRWRATDGNKHVAEGRTDFIRFVTVPTKISPLPFDGKIQLKWIMANGNNAVSLSATAFYFGQEMFKALDVPIGLVVSCWSGSRIEPWIPPVGFDSVPALKNTAFEVNAKIPGTPEYKQINTQITSIYEKWLAAFKKAVAENTPRPTPPAYPKAAVPYPGLQYPTMAYNRMIYPLLPFAVKGAIWYQGCSNLGDGANYFYKLQALTNGWRKVFDNPDMPFYIVQLAPYTYPSPYALPLIWETQQKFANAAKNVKLAIINDIGDFKDIHPHNKKDVGKRLSLLALKYTHGKTALKADSPQLTSFEVKDGKFILKFKHVEKWLLNGKDDNFELADIRGNWERAKFEVKGTDIIVSSDKVKSPSSLRYMWHQHNRGNLWNEAGLPLGAFRCEQKIDTDNFAKSISENTSLIYECDLKTATQADGSIKYIQDNSAKFTGKVKKIIYYIELVNKKGDKDFAFIMMDAFTGDVRKIGVPVIKSGFSFAGKVKNLKVITNSKNIKTQSADEGRIEFWPKNYKNTNEAKIPGANNNVFDFGDTPVAGGNYGSMQIHNPTLKETIFAFNGFVKKDHDLGLGNQKKGHPDWTFAGNSNTYSKAILKVYAE